MNHHSLQTYGFLACLTLLLAGCQTARNNQTGKATSHPVSVGEAEAARGVFTARFQATVYELQADPAKLEALNAKVLQAKGGTAEALLKELSQTGATRILYRFDQPVNVFSETLQFGTREPVVTGTRMTSSGQSLNTVQYQNVGVVFRFSAQMPPASAQSKIPDVTLSMELASVGKGAAELAPGHKAPPIYQLSTTHKEALEFGQPRVSWAVSSASSDPQQPPIVYVIRYLFNR